MRSVKPLVINVLTTVAILCSMVVCAHPEPAWKLKREEDGIKVYTANTDESCFKSVKVECVVNARLSQLIAFLMDVDKQHDWVYGNKSSRLLRKVGSTDICFYSEVSVPWPATNRDYIAHITVNQRSPELVTIDSHSEPDMVPEIPGKVRVRRSTAHWEVTALNSQQLKIVYTVEFDPAGSVPAWLINLFLTKGPMQTFQKLREEVNKPPFNTAHAEAIKDYL